MEIIFEIIIGFVAEVLIGVVGEALLSAGFHCLSEVFKGKKRRHPVIAGFGFILWGAIFGGISLLIFPKHFIDNSTLQIINLIVTPVLSGLLMSWIGSIRRKRGKQLLRIDSFVFGALLAFSMAVIRCIWAV